MDCVQRSVILFLCFALVAIFVAGLLAIATPSDALDARVALEVPLKRWKALGGSEDLGALAPRRIPAGVNAAPVYRRAFAELARLDKPDRAMLNMSVLKNRPRDLGPIGSRLDVVVAVAHEAARISACEWNRDFYRSGAPTADDLRDFDQLMKLAVAVAAHAMDRAETNDFGTAVADIAVMRRMAVHAASHPHVTQAAMGLFIDIAALDVLERLFRDHELPGRGAIAFAVPRDHRAAMRRTLLTHGTGGLLQLDDPNFASTGALDGWQRDRAKVWLLEVMCDYVVAFDEPGSQELRSSAPPEGVEVARVLVPAPSVLDLTCIAATRNDMVVAAIKLRVHRALTGDYPSSRVIPVNP
ncbi:MAG: hypothetical protein V3S08_00900, partial [Phycisphaerales bacterium]